VCSHHLNLIKEFNISTRPDRFRNVLGVMDYQGRAPLRSTAPQRFPGEEQRLYLPRRTEPARSKH